MLSSAAYRPVSMENPESLPTRHRELIVVAVIMMFLNFSFTVWRMIVSVRRSFWMGPSDWLMILAALVSNAGIAITVVCGFHGAGRLLRDSFWQPNAVEKMVYLNHLTFVSQLLNVFGVWIVNLSVCAYLLTLNISKTYRWIVWGTLVLATISNFLLPVIQQFGLCRPLAARWDTRIMDKHCWSRMIQSRIVYTQAISNIITDLVYATAPIAYLRSLQFNRRTEWSVLVVVLLSLVCAAISALKLWDFHRIQGLREVYYESVTLFIWSTAEVSIGIVVVNLPPLRKSFDGLFKHIHPPTSHDKKSSTDESSNNDFDGFKLPKYRVSQEDERWCRIGANSGGELHDVDLEGRERSDSIVRTTKISVDRT